VIVPVGVDLKDLPILGNGLQPMPDLAAPPELRAHAGAEIIDVLIE